MLQPVQVLQLHHRLCMALQHGALVPAPRLRSIAQPQVAIRLG